jgi:ATP citrate (pro-S)-lyase
MGATKGPITTFIVEPFVPHKDEYYLSIVSDRLGVDISFSECGGIDIEENWDKVNPISFSNTASLFGRRVYPHSHDCILFCSLHKLKLRC